MCLYFISVPASEAKGNHNNYFIYKHKIFLNKKKLYNFFI